MGDRKFTPGSIISLIIFTAAGYGIGLWQGHMSTVAADERAESIKTELRTTQDSLTKVDARANRLEARRHLDLTLSALASNNSGEAKTHLKAATELLKTNTSGPYKVFADKASEIASIAEPEELRGAVEALGKDLDSTLPIAMHMAGGASQ